MKIKELLISTGLLLLMAFIALPVKAMYSESDSINGNNLPERDGVSPDLVNDVLQQEATETPEPTETTASSSFSRPLIVVKSYYTDPGSVSAGGYFTLYVDLVNKGQLNAKNIVITFSATNFSTVETGGVITVGTLKAGDSRTIHQDFYAAPGLWGYVVEPVTVTISYTDVDNYSYSETFTPGISLEPVEYIEPTATPTVNVSRPRLLVSEATTDLEVLQPGSQFQLFLKITNTGSETARSVNMVVGGASVDTSTTGTDTPGGSYTATGGDFTNFSPLGGSNVQSLGDIAVDSTFTAAQPLIVNVSTNPGAYALKISFVYLNGQGETLVDDQVITLLVKSVPMIDIGFYQEPGDLYTFQPNILPLQIVNIGKKGVTLGNMKITASNGMIENGTLQVGYLDSGGYLTQDAMLTPDMAGEVTISVTVNYVDDFNQAQVITQELVVNVMDMPVIEAPTDETIIEPVDQSANETFWQKAWRFIKGLIGLDSGVQNQTDMMTGEGDMQGGEATSEPVPMKGP